MKPDFKKYTDELIPVIVQDNITNIVLMLGYMNEAAYQKTLDENKIVFFSRSKQRLWLKGETSGNVLRVEEILVDCDQDALILIVRPVGPACHTGARSCFFRRLIADALERVAD